MNDVPHVGDMVRVTVTAVVTNVLRDGYVVVKIDTDTLSGTLSRRSDEVTVLKRS